ncbi:MAG: xanthine dehydrogenase family protein, partial [Pseudomonadota bacterium]
MCTAAIVRAPVAHARITRLDVDAARASPGVLLVVTGAEWAAFGYGPVPTKSPVTNFKDGRPMNAGLHHCLTADVVRCAGEAIALIVAETHAQAIAAAECVEADYEDLPAVVDQVTARTTGHAPIWSHAPENLCVDFELGNREAVEAAFAAADHTVSLDIRNNRVTSAPMEPRGCLGLYDASRERSRSGTLRRTCIRTATPLPRRSSACRKTQSAMWRPMSAVGLAPKTRSTQRPRLSCMPPAPSAGPSNGSPT